MKALPLLCSNPTYKFFLSVFRCTHLKSIIALSMKLILQTPQEKTNLKVLFALFERYLSVWGHEHWKTRTSEHINANQATLHFLAETWFLLFMLNPKTHRNKAFYGKYRKRKSTGIGISDRKPHAGQIRWPSGQLWALFPHQEPTKSILNSSYTDL